MHEGLGLGFSETECEILNDEVLALTSQEIEHRVSMIASEVRMMQQQCARLNHELSTQRDQIKDNQQKIKLNQQLPYLVANVVELLDLEPEEDEDFLAATRGKPKQNLRQRGPTTGAGGASGGSAAGTSAAASALAPGTSSSPPSLVLKTTTRQNIFLPLIGLVPASELRPGDRLGVNKDSFLVLSKLPTEYDSRAKAMELDERPTEDYSDIGGLDKQIQELVEAIVLPMTHADRFKNLGIRPPKGVLIYGPPGTGKTMLARACAAQTKATFLKLAGPQLVQMFIGDGAKIVRDGFKLAKEKAPAIIFIDEVDAVGTKRQDNELSGDREVQRTMLELLNQLDGFSSDDNVKVIAATNRPDILDPALLRSGRLDRKIELPHPNEEGRAQILEIHSRKMTVDKARVNFKELARTTDDFNGAQLKAVCVEAGMCALRRQAPCLTHEDFVEGIVAVQAKKKSTLDYFA